MTFVSYAQNFEDVMLWRALKHIERGFYIDVGAQHPIVDSVSLAFYEHGWRGVHIEPVPVYADLLRQHRPDEIVIQAAMGAEPGIITFFELPETGLSTADREIAYGHKETGFKMREVIIPCVTFAEVLSRFSEKEIHWLKIDVEGYERQVLEGWGSSIKPWVVVIESTLPLRQTESYREWEHFLTELGYKLIYFDGLNRFFLSPEHNDLRAAFRCGPNIFDRFTLSGSATSSFCSSLNAKVEDLNLQRQSLKRELDQSIEHLQSLNKELSESRLQNDISRQAVTTIQEHANHLERELAGVYRSRSWRITKPLRVASMSVQHLLGKIRTGISTLAGLPARVARRVLFFALARVQDRPELKAKIERLLARFPGLGAYLRALVTKGAKSAPQLYSTSADIDWDGYPSSVYKVYEQLMRARARSTSQDKHIENVG